MRQAAFQELERLRGPVLDDLAGLPDAPFEERGVDEIVLAELESVARRAR